jgi:hypothetical protein
MAGGRQSLDTKESGRRSRARDPVKGRERCRADQQRAIRRYEAIGEPTALSLRCTDLAIGATLEQANFRGGCELGKVRVANPNIVKPCLKPLRVGKRILMASNAAASTKIAKQIYVGGYERREEGFRREPVYADRDDALKRHRLPQAAR